MPEFLGLMKWAEQGIRQASTMVNPSGDYREHEMPRLRDIYGASERKSRAECGRFGEGATR